MKQKAKIWLIVVIALLELSALSIILTAFSDFNGTSVQQAMGYICGGLFWFGLIAGVVLLLILNKQLKRANAFKNSDLKYLAMLNFFSNRTAQIVDVVLGISFILNIIALFTPLGRGIFGTILIVLFFASFHLHYVTNGKAWQYVMI